MTRALFTGFWLFGFFWGGCIYLIYFFLIFFKARYLPRTQLYNNYICWSVSTSSMLIIYADNCYFLVYSQYCSSAKLVIFSLYISYITRKLSQILTDAWKTQRLCQIRYCFFGWKQRLKRYLSNYKMVSKSRVHATESVEKWTKTIPFTVNFPSIQNKQIPGFDLCKFEGVSLFKLNIHTIKL